MKAKLKKAPEQNLDWNDKLSVLDWYNSFDLFHTYMCVGDSQKSIRCIAMIVDGLVFYNGIYYVRSPVSNGNYHNLKKTEIENGLYNVQLVTKNDRWFSTEPKFGSDINVFTPLTKLVPLSELKPFYSTFIASDSYNSSIRVSASCRNSVKFVSLNIVEFFKSYYLINCGQYLSDANDSELKKILNPIVPKFERIIQDAIYGKSFGLQGSSYWGEWQLDRITFDESVCDTIYDLINNIIVK